MPIDNSRTVLVFYAVLALALLIYVFLFGFVIAGDIISESEVAGDEGISAGEAVHVASALGFMAVVVAGLVTEAAGPDRLPGGILVTFAAILAMMISAVIVGDPDNAGGQAGPFDLFNLIFLLPVALLFALHPRRTGLLRGMAPNLFLLAGVLVVALPLFDYGIEQALLQRNSWPPRSDPHHNAHWLTMANVAFSIPLIGIIATLRAQGWKLAAWASGSLAVILGASSALFPGSPSSIGVGRGVLLAVWGSLMIWMPARITAVHAGGHYR